MFSQLSVIAVLRSADVIRIIGSLVGLIVLVLLCLAVIVYLFEQGKKSEPSLRIPALPPDAPGGVMSESLQNGAKES